jgi:hypothetical protein
MKLPARKPGYWLERRIGSMAKLFLFLSSLTPFGGNAQEQPAQDGRADAAKQSPPDLLEQAGYEGHDDLPELESKLPPKQDKIAGSSGGPPPEQPPPDTD